MKDKDIQKIAHKIIEEVSMLPDLSEYEAMMLCATKALRYNKTLDSKQGEPKAKFKAGDKVQSESGKIAIIESVDTDKYWCVSERGMTIPFKYQDKWELVKEPTSNDLVAEIRIYKERYGSQATFVDCAKHFAQWQKQKMIEKFTKWCQEEFFVQSHDDHVVQYVSDKIMWNIEDFVEEFINKMEE